LTDVADAKRILVLGEGDGRFLVRLVQQNQSASIDYVDVSGRMLELARARCQSDRVTFHHSDALDLRLPDQQYDLICTHFFLDCLNEKDAERLVRRMTQACAPSARWLISEFREPGSWARAIVRALYFFFRWTTGLKTQQLIDHRQLLVNSGWEIARIQTARAGLLVSELWNYIR
jgi:ubiquinone/menaquinone biosynthesis C-methylase UbiE